MKIMIYLAIALLLANALIAQSNTINSLIGDISFTQRFQQKPGNNADEILRIQTHLSYVEDLLRQRNISHLNKKQKRKRAIVLDLLHQYRMAGVFPKNYDFKGQRRPCFIDRDGAICAVGYLIEQTIGRRVAEEINASHKYDYLLDMNEAIISEWTEQYGLKLKECAMIQPSYGYIPTDQTFNAPVKPAYGISSGFLGGLNLGVSIMNLSTRNFSRSKTFPCIGLISGTSQIVLGLTNIRKDDKQYQINGPSRTVSYKSQNNLSYINIAAGTTTVLTSAVNLFMNRRIKDKQNTVHVYSYPDITNRLVTGIAFTRSL